MKYWEGNLVADRDRFEGEQLWDRKQPVPAIRGLVISLGHAGIDFLYETEAIPGTVREGTVISPLTFDMEEGIVVDVLYRWMKDSDDNWSERMYTVMLSELGYTDSLPPSNKISENPAFDRAMEIL